MLTSEGKQINALIGQHLSMEAFHQLAGEMAGLPYVKIVVDVKNKSVHFMDDHLYKLHAKYIARDILKISDDELLDHIDELNKKFYFGEKRDLYLGILALNEGKGQPFFTLETVEVDDMQETMLFDFYNIIKQNVTAQIPILLKPANHRQEQSVLQLTSDELPRIFTHELMESRSYVPLNVGEAKGRLRWFDNQDDYQKQRDSITWYDIIAMHKVPEDIPRLAGIINAEYTTPLSHTNVLACGWQIPNAIQLGIAQEIQDRDLDEKWISYRVDRNLKHIELLQIEKIVPETPNWTSQQVVLAAPKLEQISILSLEDLRMKDSSGHGTKAANLGEVNHVLIHPSKKLLGFYKIPRPPRPNLTKYLQKLLGANSDTDLTICAQDFLNSNVQVPRGISIPFHYQRTFLEKAPQIQQTIGRLKMALELDAKVVDSLCIELQQLIRATDMPAQMEDDIGEKIAEYLSGVENFVVRSSSNAEDLEHFSAAGIYESYNHVTSAKTIFDSIKKVWASLVSPRSVRLRQEVGISLDKCYMGVVIQEEIKSDMGGVLVTTNPLDPKNDFRNVYINASLKSAMEVVQGTDKPYQLLYNIVEGGGRTILKDVNAQALTDRQNQLLWKLALSGKLLQSHFCPDYTYKLPVDIEWALSGEKIFILQIRPYTIE